MVDINRIAKGTAGGRWWLPPVRSSESTAHLLAICQSPLVFSLAVIRADTIVKAAGRITAPPFIRCCQEHLAIQWIFLRMSWIINRVLCDHIHPRNKNISSSVGQTTVDGRACSQTNRKVFALFKANTKHSCFHHFCAIKLAVKVLYLRHYDFVAPLKQCLSSADSL